MRKLHHETAGRTRAAQRTIVSLCGLMSSWTGPVWAQAPSTTMAVGPMGIAQTECISVAQNTAAALGGSEEEGDETYRAWVRGNFTTTIICNIPGYAVIAVAGPNGSEPGTELNAVRSYFVSRANPTRTSAAAAAPAAAATPMPPLPRTVDEAINMSRVVDPIFIVGRWTDDGNCPTAVTFNQDGTFQAPGVSGRWSMAGDTITLDGARPIVVRARAVGQDRILTINADGTIGQSIRC